MILTKIGLSEFDMNQNKIIAILLIINLHMTKIFLIALLVIASQALTDKEILQQALNGLFE